MKRFSLLTLLVLLVLSVGACGAQPAVDSGEGGVDAGAVTDAASLTDALTESGATVEQVGALDAPLFEAQAQMLNVNGESVQVYEFDSEATAAAAAQTVSGGGTIIGTTSVDWIGTPHFYQQGRLVVIYVGEQEETLAALQSALGEPFLTGAGMDS